MNPDEIDLGDEEESRVKLTNPDEIDMADEEEDVATGEVLSEEKHGDCACEGSSGKADVEMEGLEKAVSSSAITEEVAAAVDPIVGNSSAERTTKFLALSKPGGNRDFLQVGLLSRSPLRACSACRWEKD